MYKTIMINFDIVKYEGVSLDEAWRRAEATGYECVVMEHGEPKWAWTPISGWRTIVSE